MMNLYMKCMKENGEGEKHHLFDMIDEEGGLI
jgi:hypothetical protein